MTEKEKISLEVDAPSIEEAIAQGLEQLGLAEDEVDIEVLDIGSKGIFKLGVRESRVRLTVKDKTAETSPSIPTPKQDEEEVVLEDFSKLQEEANTDEMAEWEETEDYDFDEEIDSSTVAAPASGVYEKTIQSDVVLHVAQATVHELLEKMGIEAIVSAHYGIPDDERSRTPLIVDINGDDLSILIGPRAETLNALQYISSLIVGKELGRAVPLVVDVQGYRVRRAEQLRRLAQRMADQAVKSGKRQVLEPMPASERRLIHIELRGNNKVTTESIGEEPRRKVTIIPVQVEGETGVSENED